MEDRENYRQQAENREINTRNNTLRGGLGSSRPHRRITEGHTGVCSECGLIDWKTDQSRGEVSCGYCGLVVEENSIDPGAEWTNHDNVTDRSRVGAPSTYTLADKGLNTTISHSDLSSSAASRHGMSAKARRDWRRRRIMDERSKSGVGNTRNLIKPNMMIRDRSGLPKPLQEEACRLYRRLSSEGYVVGRSIAGVTAACSYLVARMEGLPKTIAETCQNFEVDEKELSRMIRNISRLCRLQKVSSPKIYFQKFMSDLELPPNTMLQVERLWSKIEPHDELWQGKKPMGIAAAIIYKAAIESGNKRTQADICKVAEVSEVTLRGINQLLDPVFRSLGESGMN